MGKKVKKAMRLIRRVPRVMSDGGENRGREEIRMRRPRVCSRREGGKMLMRDDPESTGHEKWKDDAHMRE